MYVQQKCNFACLFFLFFFPEENKVFCKTLTRRLRESGAFPSSLEIDRSRCGAMRSGVISFSSFVPIPPGDETKHISRFLLIVFFFISLLRYIYLSRCNDDDS